MDTVSYPIRKGWSKLFLPSRKGRQPLEFENAGLLARAERTRLVRNISTHRSPSIGPGEPEGASPDGVNQFDGYR
ncbi:hypothetical protein D3OALGA1CA_3150 [Olavius algarvensis associated proteobacterium Delta 3]|nr:hypothetical protein D3OALGA1CA_3150 [Olavius algarvensis associated proteobacterium Delta 3]CAB5159377.1 hypothetical protein D3OALGB2SA_5331 [Olavius algarvensis associated proteobacterium Delta 3]